MSRGRPDHARALFVVAALAAGAFVVLTALVAAGVTQDLDVAARDYFRPHDVWGDTQIRVDTIVEGLRPRNMVPVLVLAALLACVLRRTWRPAAYAALLAGVTGVLTMVTKEILSRPDPHQDMSATGGSFPSGHTIAVLVCLGGAMLVLQARPRWWEWTLVLVVDLAMGLSLLIQAAHWLTDVAGGLLLGLAVLTTAMGLRLGGTDRRLLGDGPGARKPAAVSSDAGR